MPLALRPAQADGTLRHKDSLEHHVVRARAAHAEGAPVVHDRHAFSREWHREVQYCWAVLRIVVDGTGYQQVAQQAAAGKDLACCDAEATVHLLGLARGL
jgi:hypothetical protein